MSHPRLQVIRPAIAIIDVVGVLPDVDAEDRGGALNQRVLAVGRLGNLELAVLHRQPRPADRKSTRLNSSHQIISYAVFCLKKKKITTRYKSRSLLRRAAVNST